MQFIDTINVKGTDYQFQATYDVQGNEIAATYATLEAVEDIVSDAIADLVNSAPDTLNTLQELANALGGDENFSATITGEIGKKANSSDVYTKSEIDGIKGSLDKSILDNTSLLSGEILKKADKSDLDSKVDVSVVNVLSEDLKKKANISDVYNKAAADTTFALRTDIPTIPTEISTFNNDAGYLVSTDIADLAKSDDVNSALNNKANQSALEELIALIAELAGRVEALEKVNTFNVQDEDQTAEPEA